MMGDFSAELEMEMAARRAGEGQGRFVRLATLLSPRTMGSLLKGAGDDAGNIAPALLQKMGNPTKMGRDEWATVQHAAEQAQKMGMGDAPYIRRDFARTVGARGARPKYKGVSERDLDIRQMNFGNRAPQQDSRTSETTRPLSTKPQRNWPEPTRDSQP
jgi:hypothetical protein